jgi:hypothetical protein
VPGVSGGAHSPAAWVNNRQEDSCFQLGAAAKKVIWALLSGCSTWQEGSWGCLPGCRMSQQAGGQLGAPQQLGRSPAHLAMQLAVGCWCPQQCAAVYYRQ